MIGYKDSTFIVLSLLFNNKNMYKDVTVEDIKREYTNKVGVTGRQAAKILGITYKTFVKKLESYNISVKKRNSKYKKLNDKKWLKDQYLNKKKSISEIARSAGATKGSANSALRWLKIDLRTSNEGLKILYPEGRTGKQSSNWKGGRRKGGAKGKYMMILKREHPKADSSGYVMEHRLVIENKIGRYLTKDEIVHHKDGDGHNNKLGNLELTTRKKHFQDHFDGVKEAKELKIEVKRLKELLGNNNIAY